MRRPSTRIVIAALALVIAAGVSIVFFLPAEAMPSPGVCTYYQDARLKKVVGQRGTGCCGEPVNWGVVTAFRRCETVYCLDVTCPDPTE